MTKVCSKGIALWFLMCCHDDDSLLQGCCYVLVRCFCICTFSEWNVRSVYMWKYLCRLCVNHIISSKLGKIKHCNQKRNMWYCVSFSSRGVTIWRGEKIKTLKKHDYKVDQFSLIFPINIFFLLFSIYSIFSFIFSILFIL